MPSALLSSSAAVGTVLGQGLRPGGPQGCPDRCRDCRHPGRRPPQARHDARRPLQHQRLDRPRPRPGHRRLLPQGRRPHHLEPGQLDRPDRRRGLQEGWHLRPQEVRAHPSLCVAVPEEDRPHTDSSLSLARVLSGSLVSPRSTSSARRPSSPRSPTRPTRLPTVRPPPAERDRFQLVADSPPFPPFRSITAPPPDVIPWVSPAWQLQSRHASADPACPPSAQRHRRPLWRHHHPPPLAGQARRPRVGRRRQGHA